MTQCSAASEADFVDVDFLTVEMEIPPKIGVENVGWSFFTLNPNANDKYFVDEEGTVLKKTLAFPNLHAHTHTHTHTQRQVPLLM